MNIRPSTIAGSWYPGRADQLTQNIRRYLDQAAGPTPAGKIWGVVVPHAGYRYSGAVAAYGFNCLQELQPDLVVVLAPFHAQHHAPLLTTAYDAYETPLGIVTVARSTVDKLDEALQKQLGVGLTAVTHEREHALEIELPFLQHILGDFLLLPVMICQQNIKIAAALGQALAEVVCGKEVLFIASSDLSHFYPQQMAQQFDKELLRRLEAFDAQGVMQAKMEGVGFACGRVAIAAVLWAAQQLGANRVTILHQATSGDVSGDFSSVVGYGTAVIWEE